LTVSFALSDLSITVAQAATVALPGAPRLSRLVCLRSPLWALAPALGIVAFVALVRADPAAAPLLSYAALFTVPPLAAFAITRCMRRRVRRGALLVVALFAVAWAMPGALAGEAAGLALTALAAVALAVLLVQLVPNRALLAGMLVMAVSDALLVVTGTLQPANRLLLHAAPGGGLPQLQATVLGVVNCGFGDFFIAALFGAVLAWRSGSQRHAALITLVLALSFDAAFLVAQAIPATVPVALAALVVELQGRLQRNRQHAAGVGAVVSAGGDAQADAGAAALPVDLIPTGRG
jgi:hypothetical protein